MGKKTIRCSPYTGRERIVYELRDIINRKYSDLFLCVLVHGSVATDEVMSYSDFDGLLIVKDEFKDSRELHSFKRATMKRIYEFDPLQHHGWFVFFESELMNYPQTYFPHELFEYSRAIFPAVDLEFSVYLKYQYDYKSPLLNLCDSILKKIDQNRPNNMYALKGLLSQFMLLPALYCQARDQKGIFKKFSFKSAKKDFSKDVWSVMSKVSDLRLKWHYDINRVQEKSLTLTNRYLRRLLLPISSPAIPNDIQQVLTDDFYDQMKRLMNSFKDMVDVSL